MLRGQDRDCAPSGKVLKKQSPTPTEHQGLHCRLSRKQRVAGYSRWGCRPRQALPVTAYNHHTPHTISPLFAHVPFKLQPTEPGKGVNLQVPPSMECCPEPEGRAWALRRGCGGCHAATRSGRPRRLQTPMPVGRQRAEG